MDITTLKKGKVLGKGVYGTVYLTEYNKTKYALKTQHILPSDRHKSYTSDLWRELDFYDFISKMKPADKKFFTQLHTYKIYNKCDHVQTRYDIENKKAKKTFTALNKSKWCVDMVLDYQGGMTFDDYISTYTVSSKQTYSFILQIINICMILLKGGYRHTDLHANNIMIKRTTTKYFMFNRKKIPYYNYQLVSIDYGSIKHSKYLTNKSASKQFNDGQDVYVFDYIMDVLLTIIFNTQKYTYQCKIQKKKNREHGVISSHSII
jgi:serine/threonine protein kinase